MDETTVIIPAPTPDRSHGVQPVPVVAPNRTRKTLSIVGASLLSVVAIFVCSRFEREPPPPQPEPRGMKVGDDYVTLASDAPQWKVIRLGPAIASQEHWSDPVPA